MRIGTFDTELWRSCLLIAEVAMAHDGSLGTAHAFIDAAADNGANAIKFQTHLAAAESSPREAFRIKVFPQDSTRYDYWKRTEFTEEQWVMLKRHAEERGLVFLSTPFSLEAAQMLDRVGVVAWKISSGDINNAPMLDYLASTGKPFLLSTGMSPWNEISDTVCRLKAKKVEFILFQCNNTYPCPPEKIGLNIINEYRNRFGIPVGLSDHSATTAAGIGAFMLGAEAVEVHITLSKRAFGPDVSSSLTCEELKSLASSIRFLETAMENPTDKDVEAENLERMRYLFMKGIVASKSLKRGKRLQEADLAYKKPCEGMPAGEYRKIIGQILKNDKNIDDIITWEDIEYENR